VAGARPAARLGAERLSSISELPALIAGLAPEARERAERLFNVLAVTGHSDPPPEMSDWLIRHFGSVEAVRSQTVVRVTNRWTLDGTHFSVLRGRRPMEGSSSGEFAKIVAESEGGPFCSPETDTPADSWGRVRGRHAVTGANAAQYDAHHGVIVFDHHDPLAFTEDSVVDLFAVARSWAERSRAADPEASAYLLIWNCGWRAGGSVVHGHAQVLLGPDGHYARVERFRRDALAYRQATGGSYLADLVAAHRDLGLVAHEADGVAVLASLTPVKERELLVVGPPGMDERTPAFAGTVARTLLAYRDALGVRAFNLALHRPPLAGDGAEGWGEIGPVIHIVDRGDPGSRNSDIGAMELFVGSVVGTDPFATAAQLREALAG
jgi:hypothetical protein